MNIALFCFGVGTIANVAGTEKVFVEMANAFTDRGHEVWAVWNDKPGIIPYYKFREAVHQVNLGLGKIKVPVTCKIQRELNKALHRQVANKADEYKTKRLIAALQNKVDIDRFDCIVCFEFNSVMVANAVSNRKIPVAVMVHNSVEDQIGKLTELQRQEANKADVYQVLMPSFVKKAESLLKTKIVYIPNTVPQIGVNDTASLLDEKKIYTIIHIGRVEGHQKQQLILVKAFSELAAKYPDWILKMYGPIGDSSYKQKIDKFITKKQLNDRVLYKGITKAPLKELQSADVLGFPSAYEGFGLALAEAMSVGLPTVGFASAPGVGELIVHEKTGLLASDEGDFKNQLERLMKDRALRARLGTNAHEAMRQYAPDVVWGQWEDLLNKLCERKKRNL